MNALESRLALRLRPQPWLGLFASFSTGLKRFGNGDNIGGDPGVFYVYDTNTIAGFTHGTSFVRAGLGIVVDVRDGVARTASGLLVQASADYTHGIDGDLASYERLRALVGVPLNLWAHTHVLWLQAATALTWTNDSTVPFSELPTLGGPDNLRGFRFQDFRDYSSFWVTAEYRWPVWMWLDGALFFDYGGVFGENYAGFGARRMQPDVGVALHIVTSGHFHIGAQLGYGFGEGFNFSLTGNGP
jgi:outer membrane protein assembly factor BamA